MKELSRDSNDSNCIVDSHFFVASENFAVFNH